MDARAQRQRARLFRTAVSVMAVRIWANPVLNVCAASHSSTRLPLPYSIGRCREYRADREVRYGLKAVPDEATAMTHCRGVSP